MPAPGRVVVAEPIAPIVPMPAKLRLSLDQLEGRVIGPKAKIMATEIHGFLARRGVEHSGDGVNRSPTISVGGIDPVVEAVLKPVDSMLLVAFPKALEKRYTMIGF